MTYDDMSVKACADRFNAKRKAILEHIRKGKVSASMSGIEYYPKDFHDLTVNDPIVIKVALTWNGTAHIDRPNWLEEYEAYKKEMQV